MPTDHQPTFSRTSLNILILACVILILIFGQTTQEKDHIDVPPVPRLDVSIWQTDSDARVWFHPVLDDHVYIQLHYLAGFSFNQAPFTPGTSQLLVSLLNHQARKMTLPAKASLSPDYIEISIRLSTDALEMNQQIKRLRQWIYRPLLASDALSSAKKILPNHLDELWQQAYAGHAYEGPAQGSLDSIGGIHRASIQKYQQGFLHPARLFASITGNINEQAAQVIMESLLPKSPFKAYSQTHHPSHKTGIYHKASTAVLVLAGSYENAPQVIQQMIMLNTLKQLQPNPMQFITAASNNSLVIEQWPSLLSSIDTELDSDIMRQAKRQSIKDALAQTQTAQSLSKLLVWLNRYHLPSSFLHEQFSIIENWQHSDWQNAKKQWLQAPTH